MTNADRYRKFLRRTDYGWKVGVITERFAITHSLGKWTILFFWRKK